MSISMKLQQILVGVQSLDQLLVKEGPDLQAALVHKIFTMVSGEVEAVLQSDESLRELRESAAGRQHLVAKLAEQVAQMCGNTLMGDAVEMLRSDDEIRQAFRTELRNAIPQVRIERHAERADWNDDALHDFVLSVIDRANSKAPMGSSSRDFTEIVREHPRPFVTSVIGKWYDNKESYAPLREDNVLHRAPDGMRLGDGETLPDQVPALVALMRKESGLRMRRYYDVVRTADYRDARESDAPHVAEMYNSSLLREATLSLLLPRPGDTVESIKKRSELFNKRIEKGTLIEPMDPEELEKLIAGLRVDEIGAYFRLKLLATSDPAVIASRGHGILAFGSFDDTPPKGYGHVRRKTMLEYLTRGMSGGRVAWSEHMGRYLKRRTGKIIYCHDIRSTYPLAMYRLGAFGFEDMMTSHGLDMDDPGDEEEDPYVIASRLHHFSLESDVPLVRRIDRTGSLLENDHSFKVMREWEMRHLGKDFNRRKHGDHIRHYNVDGVHMRLNPTWEKVGCPLPKAARASRGAWRAKQIEHGDVSIDTLDTLEHSRRR